MGERAKVNVKAPEAKKENSASQTKKTDFSHSMNSPIDHILFLQRTIGNQKVQRLIKSGVIQGKLRINQPRDIYEQEADRVGNQIMRMPESQMQRRPEEEGEKELIQTKSLVEQTNPMFQRQVGEKGKEELTLPELNSSFGSVNFTYTYEGKKALTGAAELALRMPDPFIQRKPGPKPAGKGKVTIKPAKTKYFKVTGNTLAEVYKQLDPTEWGRCNWYHKYTYNSKNGVATKVNVTLTGTILLPKWTGKGWKRASGAAKKEWKRMLKFLRKHENGHYKIAKKWAPELKKRLLNKPETDLKTIFDKFKKDHQDKQDEYDDDTQHGQTQGVSLDTTIK